MTIEISIQDNSVLAQLSGRLDTAATTQFATDMQPLLDNADKLIILDCRALEFISSSGLRLFLSLRKAALAHGGKVTLRNLNPQIKQVFTITGFTTLFDFD